jgi:DNA-binding transcriptional MerR regulator
MRSGEVARLLGVSRDTLRYYEAQGLLPHPVRSAGGYRLYPAQAVVRIRLIRGALAIGFTVQELRRILRKRDSGAAPCREVCELTTQKLADLEGRIAELNELRAMLRDAVRSWKKQLNGHDDLPAQLLENLVAAYPQSAAALSPLLSPGLRRKLHKGEVKRK